MTIKQYQNVEIDDPINEETRDLYVSGDVTIDGKLTVGGDIDPPSLTLDFSEKPPQPPELHQVRLWFGRKGLMATFGDGTTKQLAMIGSDGLELPVLAFNASPAKKKPKAE